MKIFQPILPNTKRRKTGFTLVEVLLALFITAIIISMLSVVLAVTLRSYRQGKDLFNIADRAQLVMSQLTRELKGAMVQRNAGSTIIPFIGAATAVYFMAPVDNSTDVDLCELGYIFNTTDNTITRHYVTSTAADYDYPDSVVDYTANSGRRTFSSNITDLGFRYFDEDGWQSPWPAAKEDELPHIVEINLTVRGQYQRGTNPQQEKSFSTWVYLPNYQNN